MARYWKCKISPRELSDHSVNSVDIRFVLKFSKAFRVKME